MSQSGTITASPSLRVRAGPGTDHEHVASISQGERVTILQEQDGWYEVDGPDRAGGTARGWVSGDYVDLDPEPEPDPQPEPESASSGLSRSGTITASPSLRVRSGPGTNHEHIASIAQGERVTILQEQEGWYEVEGPDRSGGNACGWGSSDYVDLEAPPPSAEEDGPAGDSGDDAEPAGEAGTDAGAEGEAATEAAAPIEDDRERADLTLEDINEGAVVETNVRALLVVPDVPALASWVDVKMVDTSGRAWGEEEYELTLPDGEVLTGRLDPTGQLRVPLKAAGKCRIRFPSMGGLRITALDGGPPPRTLGMAGAARLRALSPAGRGEVRWSCDGDDVTSSVERGSLRLRATRDSGEDEEVSVRCTQGEETAEHSLRNRVRLRFRELGDGAEELRECDAALGLGSVGGDQDEGEEESYRGKLLRTTWEIRQDKGDEDCGPACAAFLRYGGGESLGNPKEAGRPVTGGTIQELAEQMRERTSAPNRTYRADEDSSRLRIGLDCDELLEVLEQYSCSYGGRRYIQHEDTKEYERDIELGGFTASLVTRTRRLLWGEPGEPAGELRAGSTRGVAVPWWSPQDHSLPSRATRGILHFVVCTRVDDEESGATVEYHDPGPTGGLNILSASEFFFAHRKVCQVMLRQWSAPSGRIRSRLLALVPASDEDAIVVRGGQVWLGEIDEGPATWGQRLKALNSAMWFNNYREADRRALNLAKAWKSSAVIEIPAGNFAVVETNSLDDDNLRGGRLDRKDSETGDFLRLRFGQVGSLFLIAPGDGDPVVRQVLYERRKTHRESSSVRVRRKAR